jgi:tripartite-type tricarboxylate transporter receptor subunit TctC
MLRQSIAALAALALLAALPAAAQPYPNRPIKFVIPFPPGGGLDHTARTIQPRLQELLGQPWVIENKAGAAGIVGVEFAKSQPADGYTVFLGNTGTMGLNPALYQKLPYDALKDFAPVGQLISNTLVAVTGAQVPANTLPEFIAWVKANPGKVSYASGGNGAITHLAGEMLKMQAGIDMLHVPYKGSAPAVTDLLGGQVHLLIDVAAVSQQHVKAGKLKALAITNTRRNAGFPELPTFDEVGLKGYQAIGWQGLFVPAGTPRPVIDRLSDALQKTMADPVVKEKFIAVGSEATPSGPEAFGAFMRAEIEKWSRIAKAANVKVE